MSHFSIKSGLILFNLKIMKIWLGFKKADKTPQSSHLKF